MPGNKMQTLDDLIEEAKNRAVVWAVCVLGLAYFFSLTSNSVWLNVPIAFLIVLALRYLVLQVEFHRQVRRTQKSSYFLHLQQNQLSPDDPLLLPPLHTIKWKRKINSVAIGAAVDEFIKKVVQKFVTDLWYSSITPDKEFPELLCVVINDVMGEVSQRVSQINLIDLLTRDMVDLIGSHLELYRKNQACIGVNIMATLSSEERDERLKHSLAIRKELHPALKSPENEHLVLKRLMGGVVAAVLRPQEVQSPAVRCLARELLTCVVMQPIMDFASPSFINEIIEYFVLSSNEDPDGKKLEKDIFYDPSSKASKGDQVISKGDSISASSLCEIPKKEKPAEVEFNEARALSSFHCESSSNNQAITVTDLHTRPADWALVLNAVRQRRVQVLAPENMDNLWAKGRNYKKKDMRITAKEPGCLAGVSKATIEKVVDVSQSHALMCKDEVKFTSAEVSETSEVNHLKYEQVVMGQSSRHSQEMGRDSQNQEEKYQSLQVNKLVHGKTETLRTHENAQNYDTGKSTGIHKRAPSDEITLDEWQQLDTLHVPEARRISSSSKSQGLRSEGVKHSVRSENFVKEQREQTRNNTFPKLKSLVVGAKVEKVGSRSFAVYSIAITDPENNTWFVDRRYSNFEQLHWRLKAIPNYSLHLPPKRFLSSSLDDYFVQQRCILLDKYLKDLLSIPNIAEQHEVCDFLSATSKNYSFGKKTSVIKSLAVNVDDAMDDIVRQLRGVSDGILRKVSGGVTSSEGLTHETRSQLVRPSLTLESAVSVESNQDGIDRSQILSDDEGGNCEETIQGDSHLSGQHNGWHSDSELHDERSSLLRTSSREIHSSDSEKNLSSEAKIGRVNSDGAFSNDLLTTSDTAIDEVRVPPEWTPPKLSVPLLNLVDKIFQLKRRGWLRRQVLWISKQILQLVMEDAIDDWLLRQIEWLRRDDVIALGIKWVQDVIFDDGMSTHKGDSDSQADMSSSFSPKKDSNSYEAFYNKFQVPPSFEQQLEASRRARLVYDTLLGGAPSTLVSLIGGKQYRRCAKDMYYFLQSKVCVKQLAYSLLELLLITTFPELHDVILDVHRDSLDIKT